jgi:hypothetical protein
MTGTGWPWNGIGEKRQSKSAALLNVSTEQLKVWIKKARDNGGVIRPGKGWQRDFTVAQLTAELRSRE